MLNDKDALRLSAIYLFLIVATTIFVTHVGIRAE
jgi:hypothetical protein